MNRRRISGGKVFKSRNEYREKYEFEEVEQFTYLGSIFSRKPNIEEEIEARIMAGNRCVAGLRRILKNKNIWRQIKIRLYKTVIRPIATYASETLALNKTEQIRLEVWERKILKKIFGGKRTEEGRIRRTNEEINNLYGEASIVSVIRAQSGARAEKLEVDIRRFSAIFLFSGNECHPIDLEKLR
ncbi:hypothetical protein NQ315_013310 [Exocentrus adspersus]|uniref:Uncharacterized protein n=1 Tax=Exocentrus adspersus TaxID=1586481 RepID=A0AAV8VGP6_9CUCU|nr:hypothetical protein NQ315_013310 [Exocentrus adspersus]